MDNKENKELKALQKELAQQEASLRRMRKQLSMTETKSVKIAKTVKPSSKKAAPKKKAK